VDKLSCERRRYRCLPAAPASRLAAFARLRHRSSHVCGADVDFLEWLSSRQVANHLQMTGGAVHLALRRVFKALAALYRTTSS
jgi:hypothetical protein